MRISEIARGCSLRVSEHIPEFASVNMTALGKTRVLEGQNNMKMWKEY